MICNNLTVEILEDIELTDDVLQLSLEYIQYNADILMFSVHEEDIKYMYILDTQPNNTEYSIGYRTITDITHLPYLRKGIHFISLNNNQAAVKFYKIIMNKEYCNNSKYKLTNYLIYTCDCKEHYAGRHCEKKGISDNIYYLGITCTVGSNLFMIPALISGIIRGYYAEVIIFSTNMLASMAYHMCDYNFYCFNLNYSLLHDMDFILSYFSVLIIFVDLLRIRRKDFKLCVFCFLFVMLMYFGIGDGFDSFYTELLVWFI